MYDLKIGNISIKNAFLKYLWFIPMYFVVFELFNLSVSYFYTVQNSESVNQLIRLTYRMRDYSMAIALVMVVLCGGIKLDSIAVTLFIWGSVLFTKLFYSSNMVYLENVLLYLLLSNLCYIVVRGKLFSFAQFESACIWVSRLFAILVPTAILQVNNRAYYVAREYMTFSNALYIPVAFLLYSSFMKKNIIDMLLSGVGLVSLLAFGSRGSFLLLAVFMVVLLWNAIRNKKIFIMGTAVIAAVSLLLLLFSSDNLLIGLTSGQQSRTLEALLSGHFFSSARTKIWEYLLSVVRENWLVGAGLGADRYYLPMQFTGMSATYAHNLFLEWILDFGLFGVMLSILFVGLLVKRYNRLFIPAEKSFYLLFIIAFLLQLMISRSWLTEPGFFVMIAIAVNITAKNGLHWGQFQR